MVKETGVSEKHHPHIASYWQAYCCIKYTSLWTGLELTSLAVIGTDCIGSYKSNYYAIRATTAPKKYRKYRQLYIQDTVYENYKGTLITSFYKI